MANTRRGYQRARNGTGTLVAGYRVFRRKGKGHREHIEVAERVLGHPLPRGAIVHHADENRLNNSPDNLVICPSTGYHNLIHRRMRAYAATGYADSRKCIHCREYDRPENVSIVTVGNAERAYHRACAANYMRARHQKRRSANS